MVNRKLELELEINKFFTVDNKESIQNLLAFLKADIGKVVEEEIKDEPQEEEPVDPFQILDKKLQKKSR